MFTQSAPLHQPLLSDRTFKTAFLIALTLGITNFGRQNHA
jgi:hypothetical protein